MTNLPTEARRPVYRLIAEGLRRQIVRGEYSPGARLPSTDDLALTWKSTNFTVHSALTTLVKEGWIERVNGNGTFVTDRPQLFRCAGIYHGCDIWADEHRQFTRNVHQALVKQLRDKGRTMENFTDPRAPSQTTVMLPTMDDAIEHRRIDCLIAVTTDGSMLPVFDKLKVPTACIATAMTRHRVNFDTEDMFEKAALSLAEQGCRTVGAITTMCKDLGHPSRDFGRLFRAALRRHGLTTRDEWILQPPETLDDGQAYGFLQFLKYWDLPRKPDGLFVYTDLAARGVITGALSKGPEAWDRTKFVFHRNAHSQMLCPFPATWLVSDEELMAQELIAMVERQFAGEAVLPVTIPYSVRHENSVLR